MFEEANDLSNYVILIEDLEFLESVFKVLLGTCDNTIVIKNIIIIMKIIV